LQKVKFSAYQPKLFLKGGSKGCLQDR